MANAAHDGNRVTSLTAVLNSSGASVVLVKADPTLHTLKVVDDTVGTDHGPSNALHDQNGVPTLMGVSSADGKTPVAVYADSSGNLLINSN